ncbi:MAG: hypothetical protein ACT6FF_09155 [Methanosarcinaceae archaeon]
MSTKIKWMLDVQVENGPKISVVQQEDVEAYDKIEVNIPAKNGGAGSATVEVQPGGAGQVKLLLIKSSQYSSDLTFTVNDQQGIVVKLDRLQFFVGEGELDLLGAPPQKLIFSNNIDALVAVDVEILVGRAAIEA